MRGRVEWVSLALVALVALGLSTARAQNRYKLKAGAEGKLCLSCHPDFSEKLKSRFVHTPVKTEECTGCHNPHTSNHGKLLSASTKTICTSCHAEIIPAKRVSVHQVAVDGECARCHDPHASNNKDNLLQAGNALCAGCHKAMADSLAKVKFKHSPVQDSCLNCHDPHASAKAAHLLRSGAPELCLTCHDPGSAGFQRQHANYPVAKADCVSCHNPHGSNTAGLLFDTVHAPVASRRCTQCHEAATSPTPFKTRRPGFELCRGCHNPMLNETFSKNRIHWPLVDRTGCMHCHEPHASTQTKLLRWDEAKLCGTCHVDTLAWQTRLAEKQKEGRAALKGRPEQGVFTHQPVQDGACSTCHLVHASDHEHLLSQASTIEGCGSCHDWLKHTSHPMGERYTDSRNKNLKVDCLSCHRAHGTGYRYMIPFPTTTELCVQCHTQFKR
jgi:predicted CXXCH cytochrome family protein